MASMKLKIIKALATIALTGVVTGFITRLLMAHGRTNAEILPSPLGLVAFLCIGGGLAGILSGMDEYKPLRFGLGIFLLTGGIVWVIPLPI